MNLKKTPEAICLEEIGSERKKRISFEMDPLMVLEYSLNEILGENDNLDCVIGCENEDGSELDLLRLLLKIFVAVYNMATE